MKKFIFGKLVNEENICDLEHERDAILRHINSGNNVVIYGPRNYGKTSLVKNIILKKFRETHKRSFIFFVDLFNVTDEKSLTFRLKVALERSMADIPLKKWTEEIKKFVAHMRPEFNLDPVTGTTTLSLKAIDYQRSQSIYDIFNVLKSIAEKRSLLLVFDEFQDIVRLRSAQGIIRGLLQEIQAPVIIMGSKSHLLREIFLKPKEPFYQWGATVNFEPIKYEVYYAYIEERFKQRGLHLELPLSIKLQDNMHRVPESINILCNEIMENFENTDIQQEHINQTILSIIETRQAQYEELLRYYSLNEQIIMASVAKRGSLKQYNSIEYLTDIKMNNKTVANIFKKLIDEGHIENHENAYRVNDPLLEIYLKLYR